MNAVPKPAPREKKVPQPLKRTAIKRKAPRHKKRKPRDEKSKLIKLLDAEAKAVVNTRDGNRCLRCGRGKPEVQIHWAHVFSCSTHSIRWDPENAMTLCSGCHRFWWHKEPAEATRWFEGLFPGRIERLEIKKRESVSTFSRTVEAYTAILEELRRMRS